MVSTPTTIDFFRTYLAPQRARIAVLAVLIVVDIGLALIAPRIIQQFIDSALSGAAEQALLFIGGLYLVAALGANANSVAWHALAHNVGLIATNKIRADLTLHLLKLDMGFHNARTPGEMIERVDGDVGLLTNFLSSFLVQITVNSLIILSVVALLTALDWRAGMVVLIGVLLAVLCVRVLNRKIVPLYANERQASADLYGFVEERLTGTEDIRANGATGYVLAQHVRRSRTLFMASLKAAIFGVFSWRGMDMAITISGILALLIGALRHLDGNLSLGAVYAIFAYTNMLHGPVENLTRQFGDLQSATASIGRVRDLFALTPAISHAPSTAHVKVALGPLAVDLDRVTFAYPGDDTVLHDVTFQLPAGQTLGVLGRTGSGKTTLSRLLLRLYDPVSGAVTIGDANLRDIGPTELTSRIAVVTQDIQLFSATVRENVTLFDPEVDDARIYSALDAVGMGDHVRGMPDGLATHMGAGSGLSAGQAQLLAFARAFLRDPGLIILDEASSRLDPATERDLDAAIGRLLTNRTGVIIAHRLGTLDRVDNILILEDGRVAEFGPRALLVANAESRFSKLLATGIGEALT